VINFTPRQLIKENIHTIRHWHISIKEHDLLSTDTTSPTSYLVPYFSKQLFFSDPNTDSFGHGLQLLKKGTTSSSGLRFLCHSNILL